MPPSESSIFLQQTLLWYHYDRIRFVGHNRTVGLCTENKNKEDTSVNVENPQWWEKPRQPTGCKIHYEKGDYSSGSTRATISCTPSLRHTRRLQWRQLPLSLSLSLSLTLYLCTRAIQLTLQMYQQHLKVCALSHIYTYMTFGLFTHVSPSNRSGRIGTRSSVIWFSLTSIRRDLFPNTHHAEPWCEAIEAYLHHLIIIYIDILWRLHMIFNSYFLHQEVFHRYNG